MPLARLDKARETLPAGYRFGDAAPVRRNEQSVFRLGADTCATCGTKGKYDCPDCGCWNVIEGEHAE